jgi:hypothetical protein
MSKTARVVVGTKLCPLDSRILRHCPRAFDLDALPN